MFFWFSSGNGRSRMGCCGGTLLLLPLSFLTLFGGFGSNGLLLMLVVVAVLALMVALPRLTGGANDEKLKNDELYDDYDQKPKRGEERYALTDDGEVVEVNDDEEASL